MEEQVPQEEPQEGGGGQVEQVIQGMAQGFEILAQVMAEASPEAGELLNQSRAAFTDAMSMLAEGAGGGDAAAGRVEQGVPFGPAQQV